VRGLFCSSGRKTPLTLTLSPEYRGEGDHAHGNNPFNRHASATRLIAMVYAAVR
jgi:hypothetical protein